MGTPVSRAPSDQLASLCRTAVGVTGVTSCGVSMRVDGGQHVTAHASAPQARAVEELQHTLGEGPGVDASGSGTTVLVPDLRDGDDPQLSRWPTFAREAVDVGVLATFAFPLLLGTARIGAMSLYRSAPGELSSEQLTRGLETAGSVALTLADNGSGLPGLPGLHLSDAMKVHQAAGMAMVQLGVPIDQALVRMRAIAYAEGMTVDELADAIVERRRRLSQEDA
jgi:GAF domain-containing protein